jgi:type IV pilus assembly protein PilM
MAMSLRKINMGSFFSRRSRLSLGLDIGSHSVKICELEDRNSSLYLATLGSAQIPSGAVEDGILQDPDMVGSVISNLVKNLKIKGKKAAISISGYSVIVKKISLNSMSDEEMESHIHSEAEQYIPFDIDEVYLDFQNLHTNTEDNERTDVMLVAAKKEVVDSYLDMLKKAGLTAGIVDVDAFALENSYEDNFGTEETIALVDIGASKMNINIIQNGASLLARDVAVGSRQLTEQIQNRLGISFPEAESLKIGAVEAGEHSEDLADLFASTCSQWIGEIKRALDFFYTNHPDNKIKKIVLSGGGSRVKGFDQLLQRETEIGTELFNPFNKISLSNKIDPDYVQYLAPEMAISVGRASRPEEF